MLSLWAATRKVTLTKTPNPVPKQKTGNQKMETNLLRLESYRDRQQQSMAAGCVRVMFFLSVGINCRIEDANGTN
ncbi:unnamed protein product [Sphagnum troendelagicum]|uniref:Uncharacterized protein n=1 Tax=Sphagnum troendelagicum TaxID=128251 RepID=A0ABP0UJE2_9BRYO